MKLLLIFLFVSAAQSQSMGNLSSVLDTQTQNTTEKPDVVTMTPTEPEIHENVTEKPVTLETTTSTPKPTTNLPSEMVTVNTDPPTTMKVEKKSGSVPRKGVEDVSAPVVTPSVLVTPKEESEESQEESNESVEDSQETIKLHPKKVENGTISSIQSSKAPSVPIEEANSTISSVQMPTMPIMKPATATSESKALNTTSALIASVFVVVILCCLAGFAYFKLVKRGISRRHYERVDFLIEGMYDDDL